MNKTNLLSKMTICLVATLLIGVWICAADTWYVDASRPDDNGPGDTPATAWQIIQTSVNNAQAGDLILVAPGIYNQGGALANNVTNRVYIDKALTVMATSTNAEDTVIAGAPDTLAGDGTGAGPNAVRGVNMIADATLAGFTVTNGYTLHTGSTATRSGDGGGILAASATATITNCIIRNNYAAHRGGGVYGGTYYDCIIRDNRAGDSATGGHKGGGGAIGAILYRSTLAGNGAGANQGGARYCTFYDCTIENNIGGLLRDSRVYDSIIRGNGMGTSNTEFYRCTIYLNTGGTIGSFFESCEIFQNNGGHYWSRMASGTFVNCLIYANTNLNHGSGGDLLSGTLINNTIIDNIARGAAIGHSATIVRNSIVLSNRTTHATSGPDFLTQPAAWSGAVTNVSHTCTPILDNMTGPGNIIDDPMFVMAISNDFNLLRRSPCVDTGTNVADWVFTRPISGNQTGVTNDLAGVERPLDGTGDGNALYDMGAYEYILPPKGTFFFSH